MARYNLTEGTNREYWCDGEGLVEVRDWIQKGLTNEQIYTQMNVSQKTFYTWKKEQPKFRQLFYVGRKQAAVDLENTMMKSAQGFYYEEEVVDNKGNIVTVKKWQAPNAATQIFLMKNWDKQNYRDRWELEHSGALPVIIKGEDEIPD